MKTFFKKKITKTTTLKNKLDRIFSNYIRLRDRVCNTEMVICISCGKALLWKESDCGHYINRARLGLRYNEKNCNAQCRRCNRFEEGNMSGYTLGLINKYGKNIIKELHIAKNLYCKYTRTDYEILIKHYKQEVTALSKKAHAF